jgi:endonuclease YncB( thermonuclease family)
VTPHHDLEECGATKKSEGRQKRLVRLALALLPKRPISGHLGDRRSKSPATLVALWAIAIVTGAIMVLLDASPPTAPVAPPIGGDLQALPATPRQMPRLDTHLILPSDRFSASPISPVDTSLADRNMDRPKFAQAAPVTIIARRGDGALSDFELTGRFTISDARTFGDPRMTVVLTTIEVPERAAVCVSDSGRLWGCGLRARAALNNLVTGRSIRCRGDLSAAEPIEASCQTAAGDLAAQMVAAGFARPMAGSSAFTSQLKEARDARRGMWDGGWQIRPDPVGEPLPPGANDAAKRSGQNAPAQP